MAAPAGFSSAEAGNLLPTCVGDTGTEVLRGPEGLNLPAKQKKRERRSMRSKLAILLTTVLVSSFGATACGGVQQQVEDRAREEVEKGRQQVEDRAREEIKKGRQQVEKKVQDGQKQVEKQVQEGRKQVEKKAQ
jgi:hypothetical protein